MAYRQYGDRIIRVVEVSDATVDEYACEFVDPDISGTDAVLAVFSERGWTEARVSISPKVPDLDAGFVLWALDVARELLDRGRG